MVRSLPYLPGRRPAPAGLLVILGLLAAALLAAPLTFPRAQAPAVAGLLAAPDEASALTAARATGHAVEALSDRTELSQTFANPSGTLTLNESVSPVRAHRPDGSWVPVNRTLRALPDGNVAPIAGAVDVAFSGGGTGPLARIARNGDQILLGWSGGLPAPALSGATATYADVLPGVDLQLTAQPLGFSDLLVVKSAEAARNPALATVRFALETSGLTLRATAAGGLTAVDGVNDEVFGAPAASMWDASGARRAPVGVRVSEGELDLLPDMAMLTGAGTRFPVSIDPYVAWTGAQQQWTKVDACFPDQTYWNGANDSDPGNDGSVKSGRAPEGYGDPCNGTTWRSLFQMDTSRIAHKTIHSASFNIFETWAPACNAEPLDLWWTNGISSAMGWNQQLGQWSGAHGYPNGSCSARSWVVFQIQSIVATIASGARANLTLGVRAPDESLCHSDSTGNTCQWKRFDSGAISDSDTPYLSIEYNTTPNAAADLYTDAGSPYLYPNGRVPCNASTNYINTTTPTLHATISDPDDSGSSQPQPLSAQYAWSVVDASGTLSTSARTPGSGNTSLATSVTFPAGNVGNGQLLQWQAAANDGIVTGPWSAVCNLTIDTTPVTLKPGVTSTDGKYPPGGASTPTPVGTAGAFTFDPAGSTDVAGYLYGLNTSTPWKFVHASGTGSTASVTIDPPVVGDNSLVVRMIGLGGNLGPIVTYDVITGHGTSGSVLLAHWAMDESSGATVADGTGGHDGQAVGSYGWTTGHTTASGDHAIDLTSSPGGYAHTLDSMTVDTRYGFTVSAWVKLDDTSAIYGVVSQAGVTASAYYLQSFSGTAPRWAFGLANGDVTGPSIPYAFSDAAPKVGVWTHLVGVYCADPSCMAPGDTAPGRVYLYVDDGGGLKLQSTRPAFSSPWLATGATEIGRNLFNGAYVNGMNGAVDDVSVYWGDPCPQPAAAPTVSTCGIP